MTYEDVIRNANDMAKEYGEEISKTLKSILITLKDEGKTADEAIKWIGDNLKRMK